MGGREIWGVGGCDIALVRLVSLSAALAYFRTSLGSVVDEVVFC